MLVGGSNYGTTDEIKTFAGGLSMSVYSSSRTQESKLNCTVFVSKDEFISLII